MQYNVHAAKTHLSKLIEAARNGEEVVLAKGNRPVARIVPISPIDVIVPPAPGPIVWSEVKTRSGFKFGTLKGIVTTIPEFGPMSEEELDEMERREDDLFNP